ncbi:hypothetical protein MBLNU457_g1019t1 [Dothideomycetes sp. NU457]
MELTTSNSEKKPRGILKNAGQAQSPETRTSPVMTHDQGPNRPGMARELSEKEITQMNTNINAQNGTRRNSSNPRGGPASRRQSQAEGADAGSPRLKWDEANLYLNEGQMGGRMKIDEPKTPYAGHYDPAEDEDDVDTTALDPEDLMVDELDKTKANRSSQKKKKSEDIPDLDLGEPEVDSSEKFPTDHEKRVMVDADQMDLDGARHGEQPADMTSDEREKHRKFEEARKKHYEMRNVKGLLGHADDPDE